MPSHSLSSATDVELSVIAPSSAMSDTAPPSPNDIRSSIDITDQNRQSSPPTSPESSTVLSQASLTLESSNPKPPAEDKKLAQLIPAHSSRSKRRILSSWWWWWEIGAVLLNVTCMCLVVATLLSLNGELLSSWNLKISPNAVIAVLTTVGKMALLVPVAECISQLKWLHFDRSNPLNDFQKFDDASRGPWGALKFVWEKKGKSVFASISCLITIFSLAFEPSAQQILDFPTRTVQVVGEKAGIGIASQFSLAKSGVWLNPVLSEISDRSPKIRAPTISFQLAVLAGLTGGTVPLVSSCSTAYCQFGDVNTLGLCANCEDITHKLTRNCTHYPARKAFNGTYSRSDRWTCSFMTDEPKPHNWGNMTLYGSHTDDESQPIMYVRGRMASAWNIFNNKCGGFATLRRRGFKEDVDSRYYIGSRSARNLPATTDLLGEIWSSYPDFKSAEDGTSTADLVESHVCSWEWCERTITNLSIINGETHQDSIVENPLTRVVPMEMFWDEFIPGGEYELVNNNSVPQRVYRIHKSSEASVFAYITTLMHKNLYSFSEEVQPDPIAQILHHQDIHKTAHDIALSLSNAVRNSENVNATTCFGKALRQEVFVHVRWIWLVLPISLTVASTVLLVICIILSDASPTPLLKSNALATLFHGTAGFTKEDLAPPVFEDATTLSVKTKMLKAQFRRDADGVLKFEKVE